MANSIVYLNGNYVGLEKAKISPLDRGFSYGDGIFETMRAYRGKVFRIDEHLKRLFASAASIFLDIPFSKEQLGSIIYTTLEKNNYLESIIRLTVSRGPDEYGLAIQSKPTPTLLVHARPLTSLEDILYKEGAAISTFPLSAFKTSRIEKQIKSCNYLSQIMLKKLAGECGSFEAITVNEKGEICEGSSCNIFIVKGEILNTPPVGEYVLDGITRKAVLEIAGNLGIKGIEQEFGVDELYNADEAFLTNTGIEIMPACLADNRAISSGKPGNLTRRLQAELSKLIEDECQK